MPWFREAHLPSHPTPLSQQQNMRREGGAKLAAGSWRQGPVAALRPPASRDQQHAPGKAAGSKLAAPLRGGRLVSAPSTPCLWDAPRDAEARGKLPLVRLAGMANIVARPKLATEPQRSSSSGSSSTGAGREPAAPTNRPGRVASADRRPGTCRGRSPRAAAAASTTAPTREEASATRGVLPTAWALPLSSAWVLSTALQLSGEAAAACWLSAAHPIGDCWPAIRMTEPCLQNKFLALERIWCGRGFPPGFPLLPGCRRCHDAAMAPGHCGRRAG